MTPGLRPGLERVTRHFTSRPEIDRACEVVRHSFQTREARNRRGPPFSLRVPASPRPVCSGPAGGITRLGIRQQTNHRLVPVLGGEVAW